MKKIKIPFGFVDLKKKRCDNKEKHMICDQRNLNSVGNFSDVLKKEAEVKFRNIKLIGFRATKRLRERMVFHTESLMSNWNKKYKRMGLPVGNEKTPHLVLANPW